MIAWEITELLVVYFNLWECHIPKNPPEYTARLGSYQVSPHSRSAIYNLHHEICQFVRLVPNMSWDTGRGTTTLHKMLSRFLDTWPPDLLGANSMLQI